MKTPPLQVMIDIETLGEAILEIAAATFSLEGEGPGEWFQVEIDLLSSIAAGLAVDAETAEFHLRKNFEGHLRGKPLAAAVMGLHVWIREKAPGAEVWAWGMDFERQKIERVCQALGMGLPWHYVAGNCARTVWKLAFPGKKHAPRKHRAESDVVDQIIDLQAAVQELKGGRA